MKKILVTLLAFVSLSAFAQNSSWDLISQSKDKSYVLEAKKGSFILRENGGSLIIRAKEKDVLEFYYVFMTQKDCNKGFGEVHLYDTNDKYTRSFPYVNRGGAHIQHVADFICILLEKPST